MCVVLCVHVCVCVGGGGVLGQVLQVLGRMCVVLKVLSRSVVPQVLGRMSVVLQVLGMGMGLVLQVLGLMLVLGLVLVLGRGLLRSSLFTHHCLFAGDLHFYMRHSFTDI